MTHQIEATVAVLIAAAGTVHAQPSKITVEQLSTASKPGALIDDGLALRSDCQPAQNCQAGWPTTAYNTTQFVTAEDFVPAESGFITTSCFQGVFWNGLNTPDTSAGDCSDFGTEEWTLSFYKDTVGNGLPDTEIGSVTFCTGVGCPPNADPNFISANKDAPTGNPDIAGIPLVRISVTHTPLGDDGFGGVTPLNAGECYFIEWQTTNSDTTSGVFGCSFFHQAGVPGNGRAFQDADFDGYDCCELLADDLSLCIDLALDNSAVLLCDQCQSFHQPNDMCVNASPIGDGSNVPTDTRAYNLVNADLPQVPGLEGYDLSANEIAFYSLEGTGTRFRLDLDSDVMDTVLAAYCGACDERYYGIIGNDDRAPGDSNSTIFLDTEPGRTYYIICTSRFKCGPGILTTTDLGTPSSIPPETCGTCTLSAFSGLPIDVDEAAFEPCDDTGSNRLNDGCNIIGATAADFMPITPGQRIHGSSWQLVGTRDSDWFVFTLTEPARVRWTAEAQFNFNVFLIDIGGDISNPDCAGLEILADSSALRCNTASADAVLGPGDYVAWVGSQEFDFGECSVTPSGYGPDTAYDAILDVAQIYTPCSPADLTTQGAGLGDLRYGLPDQLITGADIGYYVNAWIAGDLAIADITTTGAGIGDPGYGDPDGQITAADVSYYVNIWIAGCP